jgi:signal peptidase I
MSQALPKEPVDFRIVVYRFVKQLVIILAIFFAIKLTLFDIVDIHTTQMSPVLVPGDVVLAFCAPFAGPFSRMLHLKRGTAVVFTHAVFSGKAGCQRIAGLPGDIVSVDSGVFSISNYPNYTVRSDTTSGNILPPNFSPRDFMAPFAVPKAGDEYLLDTLTLRDFAFVASAISQENPKKKYSVRAELLVDQTHVSDYYLKDFALYRGFFDSIPAPFYYDWFFWDRLNAYLNETFPGKTVRLRVSLFESAYRMSLYKMKEPSAFLLSDHWDGGFDSRYFGPVRLKAVKGQIMCVLWSASAENSKFPFVNFNRLFKIVH